MKNKLGIKKQNFEALTLFLMPNEECKVFRFGKPPFHKRGYICQLPTTKIGSVKDYKFGLIKSLETRTSGGESR